MKQFLITVAGVLVGLILFVIVAPIALVSAIGAGSKDPQSSHPSAMVLTLDLRAPMNDQPNPNGFAFDGGLNTVELVRTLDAAGRDSKVKGLYIRANTTGMAPAQSEEIRAAIANFRKSGKFVYAHMQVDTFETSLSGYAATAGAEKIWLQETGEVSPMGLAAEESFLGGFFAKYKLKPEFEQRDEYKNAVNGLTQTGFTPAHREATEGLIGDLYRVFIANIAADRGLTVEAAQAAIAGTPYEAREAVTAKLVDALGRPEDVEALALEKAGKGAELFDINDYTPPRREGPVIALVTGEGGINTGPGESSPFSNDVAMNSDVVARALLDAAEDEDVKAIVFRVSSPGGSPVASDQIFNAVEIAKKKGKKVVVSMGEYAASGGYYVSANADAIIASPTTITGSIGIFGGKLVVRDAMESYLAVKTDEVKVGSQFVNMFTASRPFSNAERAEFAQWIDRGYLDFKSKVAAGRKIPLEKVGELAKGRVWTGAQAKERGLVDELGGLSTAVEKAKALAGLKPDQQVRLRLFPEEKSPIEQVQELFGVSAEGARAAAALSAIMGDERVKAALREAAAAQTSGLRAESQAPQIR